MYYTHTYMFGRSFIIHTDTHTYIFGGSFIFHLNLVFATSDEFWEYLKNELSTEEAKNAKIADEIEGLSREYVEGYSKLGNGIEGLSCSLELIESQGLERGRVLANFACSTPGEDKGNLSNASAEYNFKILELGNQLEKSNMNLKSLQDLESTFNRFEAT
ncbi:uncharacterized protein LOC107764967 isoform X2 [Nicotiana tabacum]|uniref:Uncharacterized protein isoform X1 n=2 Tax=Nicotiana tabacum TaxID=4097 RepID=A0A1S3XH53_TOBAC|nr:PREDICTED: uncharacterized protein LOC107764967 isoform X1 [Nicotiana tabacum]